MQSLPAPGGRGRSAAARLLTPGWLAGHVLVWAAVATCLGLGWWQAGRAAEGNTLSYGYTLQWPLFAAFLILMWVREMRQTLRKGGEPQQAEKGDQPVRRQPVITARVSQATKRPVDEADPQLAEYNRYLAWLNEHPEAKPSDYPG